MEAYRCPDCGAESGRLHEPYCTLISGVPVRATFEGLGIPFPLHEDHVEGTEFLGMATCTICRRPSRPCFDVDAIISACGACGTDNVLEPGSPEHSECRSCGGPIPRTPVGRSGKDRACYDCLRGGRAAIVKDTEYGLITWEGALDGLTAGIPAYLVGDGLDVVPVEDDDEEAFVRVRLPREQMLELLRTPSYSTWQGERWLFCCRRPMIFVGNWSEEKYSEIAPDGDTERLFREIIGDAGPEGSDLWGSAAAGTISVYVFRCPECGRYRGHWDSD
jgi:uncharacterized protein CbrC (UPF0167 family)